MTYRDRGGRQEPPLPKPYEFVPLPESRLATGNPTGHHRYQRRHYSGTLTARITARSPVHVASGLLVQTDDRRYPLVKGHFRTGDQLAIPGTSLKGCFRSIVEAITRSSMLTRSRDLPDAYKPPRRVDQLDVAQRIFGALGYQGMVRFNDALFEGEAAIVPSVQLFRPRSEAIDAYFDGRQPRGRKFYMHGTLALGDMPLETCDVGGTFGLNMAFESLSAGELGLVLIALGLGEPRLWPKLGGGKPACLGTIEIDAPVVIAFDGAAAYVDFDAAPQSLSVPGLIQAAHDERLVLAEQLRQLADILRWPREDRDCPDRNY